MQKLKLKLNADDAGWMQASLIALNDEHPVRRSEMRRLIQGWQDAGRDAAKMLRVHPELKPYLFDSLGRPSCRALLIPEGSGLRVMLFAPEGPSSFAGGTDEVIKHEARLMFMQFLLIDPTLREKLSEQPCLRCDNYYAKNTARQTVYCSRKCAKDGTAAFATKERLKSEHANKLRVAAEQAQRWTTARTKVAWKQWVSTQHAGRELGITPKFLTRAINKGDLVPPQKGK